VKGNSPPLALATIDSFFSWTEHIFIHLAILNQKISTGKDVSDLSLKPWQEKFKKAIDICDPESKRFYDDFLKIRKEIRNFVTHGYFGKDGKAFYFHSNVGYIPVYLSFLEGNNIASFSDSFTFDEDKVIKLIRLFIAYLWKGQKRPAMIYLDSHLPSILSFVKDGSYSLAMNSVESMKEFIEYLTYYDDLNANMDW
jgi:hypothetical protein